MRFGGGGPVVGWLVHMQRLPADRLLDALITSGQNSPSAGLYFAPLQGQRVIDSENLHRIARMGPEISAREKTGMLVEGHSDLLPEDLCLTNPLVMVDRVVTRAAGAGVFERSSPVRR